MAYRYSGSRVRCVPIGAQLDVCRSREPPDGIRAHQCAQYCSAALGDHHAKKDRGSATAPLNGSLVGSPRVDSTDFRQSSQTCFPRSNLVGRTGLEPVTPCASCKCATNCANGPLIALHPITGDVDPGRCRRSSRAPLFP